MTAKTKTKSFDRAQLLTVGLALGMVACFVGGVYWPNTRALDRAQADLKEARGQLAERLALAADLPQVAARVEALREKYERELLKVPPQPTVPQFLGKVADILQDEGVTQRNLVPQPARAKGNYAELPILINFEAPFMSAFRVLARLEQVERINRVASVALAAVPATEGRVRVEMAVIINHSLLAGPPQSQVAKVGQPQVAGKASL